MTAVRSSTRTSASRRPAPPVALRREPARRPVSVAPTLLATRRLRALWIAGVTTVLIAVLTVTASQAFVVQGQDRLDDLQRSLSEQRQVAERQQLQLAELQSPERVVAAATERLGMVAPADVVHLRSDFRDDEVIRAEPEYPGAQDVPEAVSAQLTAADSGVGAGE